MTVEEGCEPTSVGSVLQPVKGSRKQSITWCAACWFYQQCSRHSVHELLVAGWGTASGAHDGIALSGALVDQLRALVLFCRASGSAGIDRLAFADAEVKAHVRRVHAGVNNNGDEEEENREKVHGDRSFKLIDVSSVSMRKFSSTKQLR